MTTGREQTGKQFAFGRQSRAIAVAAKRLRHTGDNTDLAAAVGITPALCGFTCVVGLDFFQRHALIDAADHFSRRNDFIHLPAIGGTDIHVFDKAQNHRRAFEVACHGHDLLIIHAAFDDHVDLDGAEPDFLRDFNAMQNISHWKIDIVHALERGFIQ